MEIYIISSNGESVEAFDSKQKVIEDLRGILDDDNGAGWNDSYYNDDFKAFIKGEKDLKVGETMHIEGGVSYLYKVSLK